MTKNIIEELAERSLFRVNRRVPATDTTARAVETSPEAAGEEPARGWLNTQGKKQSQQDTALAITASVQKQQSHKE